MRRSFSAVAIATFCVLDPTTATAGDHGESISGRIVTTDSRALSDVVVTLRTASGSVAGTDVTDNGGHYKFKDLPDGDYTVTPAKRRFAFSPNVRTLAVSAASFKQADFDALPTYVISGRLTTNHGGATARLPLAGGKVDLSRGTTKILAAVTDSDGRFVIEDLLPGNYVITPRYAFNFPNLPSGAETTATFSPASRNVVIGSSDVDAQDFNGFNTCGAFMVCTDTDSDGICDAWERNGVDMNGDGRMDRVNDLELPGADPARKDIYLEIDYMQSTDHSHRPNEAAIQAVVDAFARQGIALHVDPVHDAIPEANVVTFEALNAACSGLPPLARNFYELKSLYSDPKRRVAYHYALFAHYHTCNSVESCSHCSPSGGGPAVVGSTGIGELPGNDFVVSAGAFFDAGLSLTVEQEAGLLMHELGHNLGIRHGGSDDIPFKPNYLSVVNPNFTFTGIPVAALQGSTVAIPCTTNADCPADAICAASTASCTRIDYSHSALAPLDERNLNEPVGIAAGSRDITAYNCTDLTLGAGTGAIDWNCNGDPTELGVVADINSDGAIATLNGNADWPNLFLRCQCTANGSQNGPAIRETGLTLEQARTLGAKLIPRKARITQPPLRR